jgi:hypothetical protein
VFLAAFRSYSQYLAPGEVATVMIIATDRRQARVVMRYVIGFLEAVPMLTRMIEHKTAEAVELSNRTVIEVHTCSFRSTRGYSIAACIADEIAFWRSEESANPDTEVINAIRPGMSTIPNSLLLCISSPYARRGELWNAYRRYFGKESDSVLVWQAATTDMNPTVSNEVITTALEQDEASARAEYFAEFRKDIESFVLREAVDAVTVPGRLELPPISNVGYFAFTDPSGGSQDSFSLAIGHREPNGKAVLDAVREVRPPFSPEKVVENFCQLLHQYRLYGVMGDRYAGEWPREQFAKNRVRYLPATKPKSDIYRDLLPLLNSGRIELLDNERLFNQLCNLERRVGRSGKDSIDHGPRGHDDVANAAAGVLTLAARAIPYSLTPFRHLDGGRRVPSFLRNAVVGSVKVRKASILSGG